VLAPAEPGELVIHRISPAGRTRLLAAGIPAGVHGVLAVAMVVLLDRH
jgi:hypothetical protein